ncbi:hydroxyacylglutathione hydrolase [Legionella brunensis]|uniref:Hydroxyacylglutathione hydrolase n=1 Tax=Legionella brunensis TaxID=29422 RepID=A0A0W0S5Q2_9GAMM|nr:hydroxyacylglutathione hydrolase [Legionella brunensis]KTC78381.1 hydroxyacylglutathione hydrolase (glyoxalase II) [Legionella brunensis]
MKVLPLSAFHDNYIWLLIEGKGNTAFCVDPGDAKPVLDYVNEHALQLKAIVLTHHHYDHIGGVSELVNAFPNIEVYGPEDARIHYITHTLTGSTKLSLLSCNFQIIETPGHTATHISLYEPNHGWLFCGDTLFSAGCGRVFDGTIEELYGSLNQLKGLPDQTKVFCAHEYTRQNLRFAAHIEPNNLTIHNYAAQLSENNHCSLPSTIALEKEINPFLRSDQEEVKNYAKLRNNKNTNSFFVFKQLRADKDNFS